MKRVQREPYLLLTGEFGELSGAVLCSFCRYAEWSGSCGETEIDCEHPLCWELPSADYDLEPGDDCWGFRPAYSRKDCVDMVGIWLQGKSVDMRSLEAA